MKLITSNKITASKIQPKLNNLVSRYKTTAEAIVFMQLPVNKKAAIKLPFKHICNWADANHHRLLHLRPV